MIFARQLPPVPALIAIGVIFIALGFVTLWLFRGYERMARWSLGRGYSGLQIHAVPEAGDVVLAYHTYHGVIAWTTQSPHHVVLPPEDARKLLGRLLRFNLTWGLLSWGCVFVLLLSIANYVAQRRSITAQQASGGILASQQHAVLADEPKSDPDPNPYASPTAFAVADSEPRSRILYVAGWIVAGFAALFAATGAVGLAKAEFEQGIVGIVMAILFAVIAKDWIGRRPAGD